MVGLGDVLHTTPLEVIWPPPALVTSPPDNALIAVVSTIDFVDNVGGVKVISFEFRFDK
jgi:hypothetical protein